MCSVILKKLFFCVFCSVLFFVCVLKKNYSFVRKLYCLKKGPYSVFLKIVDCDLCFFRESATFFGRKCTLFFCLFLCWLKCLTPPHLQWPVWSPANSIGNDLRLALTYPDYPIHIPTLTLRRITTALAARQGKGIPVTLGLNTDRIRGFNIFIVVPYVPILIVNNAIVFLSHVHMIRIRASSLASRMRIPIILISTQFIKGSVSRDFRTKFSRRNRNRIWKYLSLFIRGPDGFESGKNEGGQSRDLHSRYSW